MALGCACRTSHFRSLQCCWTGGENWFNERRSGSAYGPATPMSILTMVLIMR